MIENLQNSRNVIRRPTRPAKRVIPIARKNSARKGIPSRISEKARKTSAREQPIRQVPYNASKTTTSRPRVSRGCGGCGGGKRASAR